MDTTLAYYTGRKLVVCHTQVSATVNDVFASDEQLRRNRRSRTSWVLFSLRQYREGAGPLTVKEAVEFTSSLPVTMRRTEEVSSVLKLVR